MTKKKTPIFDQDKMTEILNQEALKEVEFTKKVCDGINSKTPIKWLVEYNKKKKKEKIPYGGTKIFTK